MQRITHYEAEHMLFRWRRTSDSWVDTINNELFQNLTKTQRTVANAALADYTMLLAGVAKSH